MKSVKNQSKQKYTPCELNVVEFNVERGFAITGQDGQLGGNSLNPLQITSFSMRIDASNQHGGGFYNKEAQYGGANGETDANSWF